jgi:hypothetical protein
MDDGSYKLDGSHLTVPRETGLDVVDLSISKQVRRGVDFNFAIDNLNYKLYWETQNFSVSRMPNEPTDVIAPVHGTPEYPIGVTVVVA